MCIRATQSIEGKIPISSIIESTDKPTVTFEVPFTAKSDVRRYECSDCRYKDECICVKLGDEGDNRYMTIIFGLEFEQSDFSKVVALARMEKEMKEREQARHGKEQTLKVREQEDTMAKNIFNMNMEFGPKKDKNIASTMMGVAVKNGDSWRIYDRKNKEITDVGDMQLRNLPIFILPTTQLSEGDLIKDAGEYYFVTKVATSKTPTQTLSARTGEMKSIVPIKNVPGISIYSKVIALSDSINMGDDFDVEKMAIISAMWGQTGENGGQTRQLIPQTRQLIPLMLFKDKLGGDYDTMKLLLMSSIEDDGGQMNQLLPLTLYEAIAQTFNDDFWR